MTVVTAGNFKGGVGKTTTALYLGWAAAMRRRERVLLVDFDTQHSLSRILDVKPYPAFRLEHALEGSCPVSACIHDLSARLSLLPADSGLARWSAHLASSGEHALRSDMLRLRELLHGVEGFDLVIVDSTPAADRMGISACLAADWVVVSTQAQDLSRTVATEFVSQFQEAAAALEVPSRVIGILVNLFDRRLRIERENRELLRETFGALVLDTVIPALSVAKEMAHAGGPLRFRKAKRLEEAYAAVLDELKARMSGEVSLCPTGTTL